MLPLAALLVLAVPTLAQDDPLARATALVEAGRTAEAEAAFRALLATSPGLLDAHRGLAEALAAQGRKGEAASHLVSVGRQLQDVTRWAESAELLRRATELEPASASAAALLGRSLLFDRRHAEAADVLERAVELGDGRPQTLLYLAAAHWEAGEPDASAALYRELLARDPDDVTAAHQLGKLLAWQGRYDEALLHLERAASARPRGDVLLELAQARLDAGRTAEAEASFRRVVEAEPSSHQGWYGLARALLAAGSREEAAEAMATYRRLYDAERHRQQQIDTTRAALDRGWELLAAGRTDDAERHFASLPESAESLAGRAQVLTSRDRHAEAATLLARAVALEPSRADLRFLLDEARRAAEGDP